VLLVMLGVLGASTAAQAAESSVVGQWRFDEANGQRAVDDGPSGLDGRLGSADGADVNDPARIAGSSGGALHFDGRTFVRLPAAAELAPTTMTLEAVVRAGSSPGRFRYVVSHGAERCIAGSYGLYTADDGGLAFYVFDGQDYRISAAVAPADVWNGAWHHAAGVYDGSTLRLYLDGRPVGSPIAAPSTIAYGLTSSDSYFGTYQGTCALPLRGDVDGVRLWSGPLSPDFVAALADGTRTPSPVTPPAVPSPDTIPIAPAGSSDAAAPPSREPLAPIAEGTSIPAIVAPVPGAAPKASPGAPKRACVVRPSVKRLRVGRVTVVTVNVALRSAPLKAARVIATYGTSRTRLGSASTRHDGRARLRLKPRHRSPVTLSVSGRRDCSTASLTVLRRLTR
jgi:hypothetical protein